MELNQIPPEMLSQIMALLQGEALNRSPFRPRQLNDLRLLPTAKDPRPTFFPSAEAPRDGSADVRFHTEFPKLMFHKDTGKEIRVEDAQEQAKKATEGFILTAKPEPSTDPEEMALQAAEALMAVLEGLTPKERAQVLSEQETRQRESIHAQFADLPVHLQKALMAKAAKMQQKSA